MDQAAAGKQSADAGQTRVDRGGGRGRKRDKGDGSSPAATNNQAPPPAGQAANAGGGAGTAESQAQGSTVASFAQQKQAPGGGGRGRGRARGGGGGGVVQEPAAESNVANAAAPAEQKGRGSRGRSVAADAGAKAKGAAGNEETLAEGLANLTVGGEDGAAGEEVLSAGQKKRRNKNKKKNNAQETDAAKLLEDVTSRGETIGNLSSVKPTEATAKDYYFDSYAHFGIHEEMIKDSVRTNAYRDSMVNNKHLFKDKIVLDVGCGTGLLSMFASQAGAKHVYGVDCSGIIHSAKQIVKDSGFEGKVTLIHGKIEEISLPVDKVDVIVSEWMGYALFYESMLDSVLVARDKWLAPGGIIFPDKATLWMTALADPYHKVEKIDFWDNVYGFDMSCIKKTARIEPSVETVRPENICSQSFSLKSVDISTCTKEDLSFNSQFRLKISRNDYLTSFVFHFDVYFSKCNPPICMTTGPRAPYTHWRQTVCHIHDHLVVSKGEAVTGTVDCRPNKKNHRDLDFTIDFTHKGKVNGEVSKRHDFKMR